MAYDDFVDYYQLTGLSRKATEEEIKKARKKWGRELNDARLRGEGASAEELKQAHDRLVSINVAIDVLEDPGKRRQYDQLLDRTLRLGRIEGQRAATRSTSTADMYNDIFDAFFGGKAAGGMWTNYGNHGHPAAKQEAHFIMTDTDLALLAALRDAYASDKDGKWLVKKAEDDKRDWMPEAIYTVKRDGGNVIVYRTMKDWRDKYDRDKEIKFTKEGRPLENDAARALNANARIYEGHLTAGINSPLRDTLSVPMNFDKYLFAVKSLGRKFADRQRGRSSGGTFDVYEEARVINAYNDWQGRGIKVEGSSLYQDDQERETARRIPYNEFWKRLRAQEGRVVNEGVKPQPEGQRPAKTEGGNPAPSSPPKETRTEVFPPKKELQIKLPDTDIALLAGLTLAYQSEKDGTKREWIVEKAFHDTRDFVPKEIYKIVRRADGEVKVLRKVHDLRSGEARDTDILLKDGTSFPKDDFIGEHFLVGEGKNKLTNPNELPEGYGEYLLSLKRIAAAIADGKQPKDMGHQLDVLNIFNEVRPREIWNGREKPREISATELQMNMGVLAGKQLREVKQTPNIEGQMRTYGEDRS